MKLTKKYKVEDYERLCKYSDLLERYFWDTQDGHKADKTERSGNVRMALWRCEAAHGGYVIVNEGGSPRIQYLDDAIEQMRDNYSEYTNDLRICLDRLRVYRNVYSGMHAVTA